MQRSPQSALCYHQLCLNHCVVCKVFPCPSFCENLPPKSKWYLQSKVKVNVLNRSDQVKIWDLLKGSLVFTGSWVALWEKWIKCVCTLYTVSTQFFFNGGRLATVHPRMKRAYCTQYVKECPGMGKQKDGCSLDNRLLQSPPGDPDTQPPDHP
jgi:hypothetical protein